MQFINVPFQDKDEAKQLGARWNADRKSWYIPDGVQVTAFARWLPKLDGSEPAKANKAGAIPKHKNSTPAKDKDTVWPTNVGKNYFKIDHSCIPWEACAICAKDERIAQSWGASP